jgi:hypothetical protein
MLLQQVHNALLTKDVTNSDYIIINIITIIIITTLIHKHHQKINLYQISNCANSFSVQHLVSIHRGT